MRGCCLQWPRCCTSPLSRRSFKTNCIKGRRTAVLLWNDKVHTKRDKVSIDAATQVRHLTNKIPREGKSVTKAPMSVTKKECEVRGCGKTRQNSTKTSSPYMHACVQTYVHTCMHRYRHTCMHTYIHTCIFIHINTYYHILIHISTSLYICITMHMYVHIMKKY